MLEPSEIIQEYLQCDDCEHNGYDSIIKTCSNCTNETVCFSMDRHKGIKRCRTGEREFFKPSSVALAEAKKKAKAEAKANDDKKDDPFSRLAYKKKNIFNYADMTYYIILDLNLTGTCVIDKNYKYKDFILKNLDGFIKIMRQCIQKGYKISIEHRATFYQIRTFEIENESMIDDNIILLCNYLKNYDKIKII